MLKKILDKLYYIYEIISINISFFAILYLKFHKPSVKKEIQMAGLKKQDKILHIGCGAIPYTSIILTNELDTSIVGIDIHQNVVDKASDFLKKLKKSNKILIKVGDGKNFDISSFNVIILSYGIKRQDLVLKHVFESEEKGTKIILRRPITESNNYIDDIIEKYGIDKIRSLLTQESILIMKN